jgi:hypothetical protein
VGDLLLARDALDNKKGGGGDEDAILTKLWIFFLSNEHGM